MFSKEETRILKQEFWSTFGKAYPRKWLLYNTKIKDVSFKFFVDNTKALVSLEIEPNDDEKRKIYYEKIESLKDILHSDFLPEAVFERDFYLENGKKISKIWVQLNSVSLNRKSDWEEIFRFFNEKMDLFERFFYEYEDYIRDLDVNT